MRWVQIPEFGDDSLLGDATLRHGGLEDLRHELVAILSCLEWVQKMDVNRMPVVAKKG